MTATVFCCRLLLTHDNNECFQLLMGVVKQVLVAVQETTDKEREAALRESTLSSAQHCLCLTLASY